MPVFTEQGTLRTLFLSSHPHVAQICHLESKIALGDRSESKAWRTVLSSALVGKLKNLQDVTMVLTEGWYERALFSGTDLMHSACWREQMIPFFAPSLYFFFPAAATRSASCHDAHRP